MRRKGERRIPITLNVWTERHPVACSIRSGTHWLAAWGAQCGTTWPTLAKRTGMEPRRFVAIEQGDRISRAEVDALAIAWAVSSEDLKASIGDRNEIVE